VQPKRPRLHSNINADLIREDHARSGDSFVDRDSVDPSIRQDHASLSDSFVDRGVSRDDTPDYEPEPEIERELNERPDIGSIADQ
jgi:hypothetical protein